MRQDSSPPATLLVGHVTGQVRVTGSSLARRLYRYAACVRRADLVAFEDGGGGGGGGGGTAAARAAASRAAMEAMALAPPSMDAFFSVEEYLSRVSPPAARVLLARLVETQAFHVLVQARAAAAAAAAAAARWSFFLNFTRRRATRMHSAPRVVERARPADAVAMARDSRHNTARACAGARAALAQRPAARVLRPGRRPLSRDARRVVRFAG